VFLELFFSVYHEIFLLYLLAKHITTITIKHNHFLFNTVFLPSLTFPSAIPLVVADVRRDITKSLFCFAKSSWAEKKTEKEEEKRRSYERNVTGMGHEEIFIFVVCFFFAKCDEWKSSFGKSKPVGGKRKKKFISVFLILSLFCVYVKKKEYYYFL
jgi:hypothetical protein